MMDPRIYRTAFLPALAAIVALMFSLEAAPEPLEGPVSTPTFNERETARLARSIAALAPSRTPGSTGDAAVAARVLEDFSAVGGGEVSQQRFESSFEGDDVELENVVLTLPGRREEVILVVASRDSPVGEGAPTSAAATATLLELARELGSSRHERTIVLASLSGASAGSPGVSQLIEELPAPRGIEAAIVISQPGVEDRVPPFVIPGRDGPESVSATLLETAGGIASVQFETDARPTDAWQQLARLAIPVGTGEGEALAAEDVEAVTISGSGERPPPADEQGPTAVSSETVFAAGSSVLDLILTLDERRGSIPDGPSAYVQIGDSLLPGWPLAALALALLLPSVLAAGDVWLRDRRRNPRAARRSIPWAFERTLPPLAGLLAAYALALIGLIPDPPYPYDPGRFEPGPEGLAAIVLIGSAVALTVILIRPLRTPLDTEPQTLAAAAGLICCLAVGLIWLLNPFLALLLTPAAHIWLLPARAQGPPRPRAIVIAALLSLVPVLIAGGTVAAELELGPASALWHLLLLVESGKLGLTLTLLWCLLLGGMLACVVAGRTEEELPVAPPEGRLRGPGGYAGPGSLGGTPSELGGGQGLRR